MSRDETGSRHLRIAIVYDNTVRPDTTGEYCRRALEGMGCMVSHYLPAEVETIPTIYDLYFRVDDDLEYELPATLRPLAYWAIDTHRAYAVRATRARAADFSFCAQHNGAAQMRADGIPAAWLPLACDPAVHRPVPGVAKAYDVAFVGNTFPGDGDRTRLVDWIRKRYPQAFLGRAYGEEMARIYTAARIVFNCPIRDDVNMRVFEAAACGSLLLTRDLAANGQGLLFSTGEHLAVYRDDAELAERIAYYLRNGEERERIADAGMRHAHACHTYRHRMADLLAAALEGARLDGKYPVAQGEPRAPRPASSIPISGPARPYPCPAVPSNGIAGEPTAISRPSSASSPVVSIEVPAAGRPLVSIIIPTFNHRALTEQCVASIRGATTVPHEILIVDNGSTDGTAAWARGQGLRVIANGENRGFPAACNQGIRAAEGQYFLLLNNDTVVSAGWLERLLAHAAGCPDAGLVGPATNFASNCQQIEVSYTTQEGFLAFAERLAKEREGQAEEVEFLVGLCLLIPRVVVEHVGLLDERFGLGNYEDNDYSLRIRIGGYRLLWARDVFIHHEGHQSFRRLGREEFDTLLATNRRRYQDKWNLERYAPRRAREESLPAQGPGPGPSGEAWRLLGAGDYPRAYAAFERLVLGQPGEPQNLLGLGLAAEGRGVPEAAAMAYRGVLAMAPGNEDACRGLARVTEGGVCAGMATRAG